MEPQALIPPPPKTHLRLFVSTGEVAGDLQGSMLIRALRKQAAARGLELEVLAIGGARMADEGAVLLGDTLTIGAVGIFESWPYFIPTVRMQQRVKQYLRRHPPDLVVLIDYMGPNLAMGNYIRQTWPEAPMVYYIAPHQWVWGAIAPQTHWWGAITARDTRRILNVSDRLLAIFPEEARYYQAQGGHVVWVGHPLLDRIPTPPDRLTARAELGIAAAETVVTLLPASRHQELKYLMPTMFKAAQQIQAKIPQVRFLTPAPLKQFLAPLEKAIQQYGLQATVLEGQSKAAIAAADLAITKSGTANLEIALMNVPQVVMYKLNPISAWIARHLLKFSTPFISPVNLTEMKPVVPELIQSQATPRAIAEAALELLLNEDKRQRMLADYQSMRQALGAVGVCDRAADEILDLWASTSSKCLNRVNV